MTEELLEENPVEELYIPSGTEKKQAFLMYMLMNPNHIICFGRIVEVEIH